MKKLLYFSAPWCGPCRQFKPLMESMSSQLPITFVDVDASPQTAAQYNVRNVPTTILIDGNGNEMGRLVGPKPESEIRALYNR